jgi:hypothetical protein
MPGPPGWQPQLATPGRQRPEWLAAAQPRIEEGRRRAGWCAAVNPQVQWIGASDLSLHRAALRAQSHSKAPVLTTRPGWNQSPLPPVIQGGDFTRGDGTGGESIYGEKFAGGQRGAIQQGAATAPCSRPRAGEDGGRGPRHKDMGVAACLVGGHAWAQPPGS